MVGNHPRCASTKQMSARAYLLAYRESWPPGQKIDTLMKEME